MVVLRLRRGGRTHSPHYRIVAQEKRSKLNGAYIESIGHYHPTNSKDAVVIDKDRAKFWLASGAVPSETVTNLLVSEGILPKKAQIKRTKVMPKTEESAEAAKPAEAEAAPAEEAATETETAPEAEAPVEAEPTEAPTEEASAEPASEEK